jgi:hypothetical protein
MRWVGFLFCCLFGWMAFDSGATTGGYMAILAALFFLPPFVSWLAKDEPAFDHAKRITIGSGMMVLAFILFVFSPSGKIDAEPAEAETVAVAEAPVESDTVAEPIPKPQPVKMIELDEADRAIRLAINLSGHRCARPTEVRLVGPDLYGVHCVTNRDGTGGSNYLVNSRTNEVEEI